jgi:hypothetical protein
VEAVLHSTLGEREGRVVLFMQHLGEGGEKEREMSSSFNTSHQQSRLSTQLFKKLTFQAHMHTIHFIFTICAVVFDFPK